MSKPVEKSESESEESKQIRAKIYKDANPEPDQHNGGQPLIRTTDKRGIQRSKFYTDCAKEHKESLACIEANYTNKELCQNFFDNYKSCRRLERERRLAENAKSGSFW
jgi:hypothetical protein|mmetsp:Transcript_3434/g.6262  ORF Transcript_3434/g.6262 Transcript_3434/m.6262 type:complete len:108 (-) Transcript_3434:1025-1348(-)